MDSDLYLLQQQNFLTMVSYYNKSREIAENYYSYAEKYKQYTKKYYNKIKQLFSYYSTSLYDEGEYLDEENDDINDNNDNEKDLDEDDEDSIDNKNIFNLNLKKENNNKIININNNSLNIKNDIKTNNNTRVDLPPIYKLTTIFFKQFKNQINGLKLFLKEIDISIKNFKNALDQIKKDTDVLKRNYLETKQNFLQNISIFQKTNKELLMDYSNIESRIAKFCLLKKNNYIYKNQKVSLSIDINKIENDLNLKLIELKAKDKDFLKKDNDKNNYCISYKNESEECIKGLKNQVLLIIENLKSSIKFLLYYKNGYHLNFSELSSDIKIIEELKDENEYETIIKQNLKEINDDVVLASKEKYNPIHYDIQNLKNKEDYNTDKENNKVLIIKLVDKMFDIKDKQNLIINNPKISNEKLSKLYKLLETDKEYRIKFLEKIGNKRANSILELQNNLYNIIIKAFLIISDSILNEKDLDSAKHVLILAQTFYKTENGEKIYLFRKICHHQLYQNEEFWTKYLNHIILFEIKK